MAGFANDLAEVFRRPEDTEEHLECLRGDFATLGGEEALRQADEADQMLEGFMAATADINLPLYAALGCAKSLVEEARERAEGYAGAYEPR
jgi:hypothetical protein